MRFNLRTMLYAVAVLAAGMGAFGIIGMLIAGYVLWFWSISEDARRLVLRSLAIMSIPVAIVVALRPAVTTPRPVVYRHSCQNNLRQIALALLNYSDEHGTFPPHTIADKNGRPNHSWRILFTPYLEREDIYKAYDFNEPWDGPNNRQLSNAALDVFRCPSAELPAGETTVFAVVGPNAAWAPGRGRKLDEFADGAEQTLLLIEAAGRGVNWLEPKDLSSDEALALLTSDNVKQAAALHSREHFLHYSDSSRNVVFADGQTGNLPIGCSHELTNGMLTIGGGKEGSDWREEIGPTASRLHWPRIWGIAVFIVLSILPKFLARQPEGLATSLAETPDAL